MKELVEKYLTEMPQMTNVLFNMIAITRTSKDLDFIEDMIDKALGNKMILPKEHKRLKDEIKELRKHK
jgi:hypothetical protein